MIALSICPLASRWGWPNVVTCIRRPDSVSPSRKRKSFRITSCSCVGQLFGGGAATCAASAASNPSINPSSLQFLVECIQQRHLASKHHGAPFLQRHPSCFGDFRETLDPPASGRPLELEFIRSDVRGVEIALYRECLDDLSAGLAHGRQRKRHCTQDSASLLGKF